MRLLFYIPIGLLGVTRWLSWFIRRIPAVLYRPVRNGHREPLAIVVPVYQEDPRIFRLALESWVANGVDEIICVIDVTDQVCMAIAREYSDSVQVVPTSVPGKRDALRRGWEEARTPLVALVDSDTIWSPGVAARVCEPFADPTVGGVATRQNVYNPRGLWQNVADLYLDYRYFDEIPAQTVMGQAVSCLSGRTAVYRRELLLVYSERFMNETFLGVPCMSGDDKRLTSLILEGGYRTYFQRSARVWSTFPDTASRFFRQRLRWARNTWRSDLRALGSRWVWRRPFLAFTMIDKAISPFTLLVSAVFMGVALAGQHWFVAGVLAAWWLVSRSTKLLPHLERRPRVFVLMPAYIVLSFVMAIVKIWALLTIREQRWLTRDVEVVDGEVVRTGPAGDHGVPPPSGGAVGAVEGQAAGAPATASAEAAAPEPSAVADEPVGEQTGQDAVAEAAAWDDRAHVPAHGLQAADSRQEPPSGGTPADGGPFDWFERELWSAAPETDRGEEVPGRAGSAPAGEPGQQPWSEVGAEAPGAPAPASAEAAGPEPRAVADEPVGEQTGQDAVTEAAAWDDRAHVPAHGLQAADGRQEPPFGGTPADGGPFDWFERELWSAAPETDRGEEVPGRAGSAPAGEPGQQPWSEVAAEAPAHSSDDGGDANHGPAAAGGPPPADVEGGHPAVDLIERYLADGYTIEDAVWAAVGDLAGADDAAAAAAGADGAGTSDGEAPAGSGPLAGAAATGDPYRAGRPGQGLDDVRDQDVESASSSSSGGGVARRARELGQTRIRDLLPGSHRR